MWRQLPYGKSKSGDIKISFPFFQAFTFEPIARVITQMFGSTGVLARLSLPGHMRLFILYPPLRSGVCLPLSKCSRCWRVHILDHAPALRLIMPLCCFLLRLLFLPLPASRSGQRGTEQVGSTFPPSLNVSTD